MQTEERHWLQAEALLDTILRVQTETFPEAALHLVVQHTLSLFDVSQSCLILREPRSMQWKPFVWAGDEAVELFNPARTPLAELLQSVQTQVQEDVGRTRKVWETHHKPSLYLLAAPLYLNQRMAGLLVCGSTSPFDEETKRNIIILAHISSIILANTHHDRVNKYTIEEKTKSDALRSNLIALSSHEMRTPLSVILGYADLLRDIGTDDLKDGVSAVRDSGKDLLDTVNAMTNLMDILGANANLAVQDVNLLQDKIQSIDCVNKVYFSTLNCSEIYCDINLIMSAIKIIADESKREALVVCSKENQGTRIDIDTLFEKENLFLSHLYSQENYFLNIDKINQNSFISAFKVVNIISMHEGWITFQNSPTSDGSLITLWIPDLPLSRFNY